MCVCNSMVLFVFKSSTSWPRAISRFSLSPSPTRTPSHLFNFAQLICNFFTHMCLCSLALYKNIGLHHFCMTAKSFFCFVMPESICIWYRWFYFIFCFVLAVLVVFFIACFHFAVHLFFIRRAIFAHLWKCRHSCWWLDGHVHFWWCAIVSWERCDALLRDE